MREEGAKSMPLLFLPFEGRLKIGEGKRKRKD